MRAGERSETGIGALNLGTKTTSYLRKAGVYSLDQLAALSEFDLHGIKGVGEIAVKTIKERLMEKGRRLKPNGGCCQAKARTTGNG